MLLGYDVAIIEPICENCLIDPSGSTAIAEVVADAHLLIHINCNQAVCSSDYLIVNETTASNKQAA